LSDEELREEFHVQTARIPWTELQPSYARGLVVEVTAELDLVEVALQLSRDNTSQFQQWIDAGQVQRMVDDTAQVWFDQKIECWAVVAAPWVLVQPISQS
jgi:hypothetical protein